MCNLNIPFSPRLVIIFEISLAQTLLFHRTAPRKGFPKGHIQFIAQRKNKFFKLTEGCSHLGLLHFPMLMPKTEIIPPSLTARFLLPVLTSTHLPITATINREFWKARVTTSNKTLGHMIIWKNLFTLLVFRSSLTKSNSVYIHRKRYVAFPLSLCLLSNTVIFCTKLAKESLG